MITGDGPEHHYVANRLDEALELAAIVVDVGRPMSAADRVRQLGRRYTATQLVSRTAHSALRLMTGDRRERQLRVAGVLGEGSHEIARPHLVRRVLGINSPDAWEALEALQPDRILVYGTGIVGRTALRQSRSTPLNMHTGISPDYRGSSCAFWPLYNRELHLLGATVHEVTAEVDGGRIYATREAQLESSDGVHEVFARCVAVGAELYVDVLQQLAAGSIDAVAQDLTRGHEYRAAMRGPIVEWKVRRAIDRGLIRDHVDGEIRAGRR
jgi:methionyl-tRNA formyltransferase